MPIIPYESVQLILQKVIRIPQNSINSNDPMLKEESQVMKS